MNLEETYNRNPLEGHVDIRHNIMGHLDNASLYRLMRVSKRTNTLNKTFFDRRQREDRCGLITNPSAKNDFVVNGSSFIPYH